jgi:hypothetical protein
MQSLRISVGVGYGSRRVPDWQALSLGPATAPPAGVHVYLLNYVATTNEKSRG